MSSLTDQLGFNFRPPERRVWKVRELVAAVRTHVEREYTDAWVEGEISNFRAPDSGHLYFTLKDGNAQIRVVMFRSAARLLRFRPADGLQALVRGRVTVYEDRGELQIAAEYIEPRGAGSLQLAFEQLKAKLQAEGLFAADKKKPIPSLPARIGVVTSPQAAALRDILNILRRRHHSVNVMIYPAQVQGDAAPVEVASGVLFFNQRKIVDVIVVARGGGSAEDLSAFNNEALARAVGESEIPVISAVGHETDFTILDFVADLRAPTPSAAAELVIRSRQEVEDHAEAMQQRLLRAMRYRLLMSRQALTGIAQHGAFVRRRVQACVPCGRLGLRHVPAIAQERQRGFRDLRGLIGEGGAADLAVAHVAPRREAAQAQQRGDVVVHVPEPARRALQGALALLRRRHDEAAFGERAQFFAGDAKDLLDGAP